MRSSSYSTPQERVLRPDEKDRFTPHFFDAEYGRVRGDLIGKAAWVISDAARLDRGDGCRLIVVPIQQDELPGPYGREKLAPVLSLVTVADKEEVLRVCERILDDQGSGHTAVIHTADEQLARRFGR